MAIAIFVRHGESEANVRRIVSSDIDGYSLTESGRDQARFTAGQLGAIRVNRLFTSPVQRARETAAILSGSVGIDPVLDHRIIETSMGKYNNRPFVEIPNMKKADVGMESWESHQKRFTNMLDELSGTAVLVSHEFPIRSALSIFLDLNEEESYGIKIRYASISVVDTVKSEVLCIGSRQLSRRILDQLGDSASVV